MEYEEQAFALALPLEEEPMGEVDRTEELEGILTTILDLYDTDDLIMNPDLELDEQELIQEILDRAEAILHYEAQ